MAEQKNGSSGRTGAKRTAQTADETSQPEAKTSEHNRAASSALPRRKKQYLIGVRTFRGFAAPAADLILQVLEQMEDVDILRRLRRRGFQGLGTSSLVGDLEIIVAQMDEKRAQSLRQSAPPHVVIEHDARLGVGQARLRCLWRFRSPVGRFRTAAALRRSFPHHRRRRSAAFRRRHHRCRPGLRRAGHHRYIRIGQRDVLRCRGRHQRHSRILVQPAADHWGCVIQEPVLDQADPNIISSTRSPKLDQACSGKAIPSWGQKAMNLDRLLGAGLTGARVKIALINSGCDNTHPLLRHITRGVDLTRRDGAKDWTHDDIGQGTHCAGIVCGSGGSTPGLNGIAPSAEIYVFKLSPGGHLSDLIDALDQCIERQIDIVHLGVVSDQVSELVTHKVIEARLKASRAFRADRRPSISSKRKRRIEFSIRRFAFYNCNPIRSRPWSPSAAVRPARPAVH